MKIVQADKSEYERVRAFYHALIDGISGNANTVGWKKDIYPSPEFLSDSLSRKELYITTEDGRIVGAMVLNHLYNDGYKQFQWPTEASDEEITVIHALGILPAYSRKGYAKQLVQYAIDSARANRQKVIRLDVLKGNTAAEKLYTGMGFKNLHTLEMYYEDTGWTVFDLYEYKI